MSTMAVAERAAWRAARDARLVRANAVNRHMHPADLAAVEAYCRAAFLAWAELRLVADLDASPDDNAE